MERADTADPVTDPSIVRVEGDLDGGAARRVELAIRRARPGDRVLVDVSRVREFHDFGVAVLGRALAGCAAEVRVHGLRLHQLHVLRYFGVDPGPLERAVRADG
jgi:hypothetical protein